MSHRDERSHNGVPLAVLLFVIVAVLAVVIRLGYELLRGLAWLIGSK